MRKLLLCVLLLCVTAWAIGGLTTYVRFGTAVPVGAPEWSIFLNTTAGTIYICENAPTCTVSTQWYSLVRTLALGGATLTSSTINAGSCASLVTVASSGVSQGDTILWAYGPTPPAPSTDAKLILTVYASAGAANFLLCNPTTGNLTPSGLTVGWRDMQ